ncbi:HNH endonuclease [Kitasatospora atroaurantiaca]|uniref:Putative restriction endonuclease n=1 Tax=Kitasatospora atroaurantiaca TaxID=285545 RepID=A0A561ET95_9ACTN|nr:HNH endonuclease [Kitasatospora atroaurantiaca]TWE18846.1 putative restriction endonuclease [Kitasatospora atroaurantiaca]
MRRAELLDALAGLRQATVRGRRAPHKPLLLLWLLGRYADRGTTTVSYAEAEEPVSRLINDFGPPVARPQAGAQRAAMPFVHLERSLWELQAGDGTPLGPSTRADGRTLHALSAVGRLRPEVEALLGDPSVFSAAVFLLLDRHFTSTLETAICEQIGLDLPAVGDSALEVRAANAQYRLTRRRVRASGFSEAVLRAYRNACAICGFDGALGLSPVGVEAAHVRWHSQGGPDRIDNAVALCSLHHALFDYGALGITADRTVRVSPRYTAGTTAGRAVFALHDARVALPRATHHAVSYDFLHWHDQEVFKH